MNKNVYDSISKSKKIKLDSRIIKGNYRVKNMFDRNVRTLFTLYPYLLLHPLPYTFPESLLVRFFSPVVHTSITQSSYKPDEPSTDSSYQATLMIR